MKLAGRVPGELHADLITYAEYYREVIRRRGMNVSPTLEIHPGSAFSVMVPGMSCAAGRTTTRRVHEAQAGQDL